MATERIALQQLIQYILDDKDVQGAIRSVKRLGDTTEELGKTGRRAGLELTKWIGGAAMARLSQNSVVAFAKYERGLQGIVFQARAAGIATGGLRNRVDEFLTAVERKTGILRQELVTPFQQLLGLTQDVDGAMLGMQVAANAGELGIRDAATAANLLGSILNGEVIEAAKSFGLQTRKANGEVKTATEVMTELLDKMDDLGDTTDDTTGAIGEMGSELNEVNLTLGEKLAPAVRLVNAAVKDLISGVQAVGPAFVATFHLAVGAVQAARDSLGEIDLMDLLLPGGRARVRARMVATFTTGILDTIKSPELAGAAEELSQIFRPRVQPSDLVDAVKGRKATLAATGRVDAKNREDEARKDQEAADKLNAQLARLQEEADRNVLQLRLQMADEHSQERLDLELQLLEAMSEARKAAAQNDAETLAAIESEFALRRLEAIQSHNEERDKADGDAHEKAAGWIMQGHDAVVDRLDSEQEETEAAESAMRDARFDSARAAVDLASALFGNKKEFAIAQALINTYEGVTRALKDLPAPFSWAAAATTAALGLAQVANIRKQDVSEGRGFDDPDNDRLARMGGRRWAADLVNHLSTGFSEGLAGLAFPTPAAAASVAGGGSTTVVNETININGPLLGGRAGVREFERQRQRFRREDRTRTIR